MDKHLAILASGNGSNAVKIIEHLQDRPDVKISVLSNKPDAPVLAKARKLEIDTLVFNRHEFFDRNDVLDYLQATSTTLIVLAGFLWLVPPQIIAAYPGKIINLHPALLPKFGGKGMYGMRVHKAVLAAGEPTSGITIHYVNEAYDEGEIIVQQTCPVLPNDTPEALAARIHALEHQYLPQVVASLL